jgi:TPR repeat protein
MTASLLDAHWKCPSSFTLSILSIALIGTVFAAPQQSQKQQTVTLYRHGKPQVVDATTQLLPNAERYLTATSPFSTPARKMSDHPASGKIERELTREENLAANVAYETAAATEKKDEAGSIRLYVKAADLGNIAAARRLGELHFGKRAGSLSLEQALGYLNKAGRANDVYALLLLGDLYSHNSDRFESSPVPKNFAKAAANYQQAADKGQGCPSDIAEAEVKLGRLYLNGQGVPRDLAKADYYITKTGWNIRAISDLYAQEANSTHDAAARQAIYAKAAKHYENFPDSAEALFALGNLYASGLGVEKNPGKARELWEKAAAGGNPAAKFALEGISLDALKNSPTPNVLKAVQRAAEHGNPQAQYELGIAFQDGLGVPKDSAQAAKWLQLAANNSLADATYALGLLYAQGNGVKRSRTHAISLYEQAANLGHSEAALELARAYEQGNGVDRDLTKARGYLLIAAQAGMADAQFAYARLLAKSDDNPKDLATWLSAAADQGHTGAERDCLKLFFAGVDVPLSARAESPTVVASRAFKPEKILQYAKALAGTGDPKGVYYLARCYREGIGTARDDEKASELLNAISAAASGNSSTKPMQVDPQNRG